MSRILWAAGRPIVGGDDLVRRYCGLKWSGGEPETWAYGYFDCVGTDSAQIGPVDVVACAALHGGLSREDLAWFPEASASLASLLEQIDPDLSLSGASPEQLDLLEGLPDLARLSTPSAPDGIGISLLSKVLHRKRPALIPLFDRSVTERYRLVTGRKGETAWAPLVHALRADLLRPDNLEVLGELRDELAGEVEGPVPTALRLLDIAVWMDERRGSER